MTKAALRLIVTTVALTSFGYAEPQAADKSPQDTPSKDQSADAEKERARRAGHMEIPHDPYIYVRPRGRATTPAIRWVRDGYVSVQVNVDSGGDNIVGDAANEPSIAVDQTDPSRIAIGWRQFDSVNNDFRQAGWGYTADGGQTWTFPGVIEPGVFRSDPVLDANAQGDFFYNSLTATTGLTEFWCHVYKSTDGGASWDAGVYAYGGDKQWMTIDRTDGVGHDNIYAYWTKWYTCPGCDGHFTRSYNGGQSFELTIDVPGNPLWGTLAVGPDGELYIAGDGFTVAKSSTMQDESLPVQWDFSTTVDLDGSMMYSGGPNPGGLLGQVWIAVDHSGGPTHGNVYLLCSVERSSTPDPLDVMFARSTDGGSTWSDPVRVNDDLSNSNYQWFGTMSVAPNGRIDAIWADSRCDPGGYDSELYYAYSEDAGVTWSVNEALSPSFDPHVGWPQQNKLGDYYDMVSDDMGVHVAYAATFNGEQDVYYLRIGDTCLDAGTVALDRAKYGCEGTAEIAVVDCGLNADEEAIDYATVDIDSDSETGVEEVTLTETSPTSARFEGSIILSTTDDVGVLWVGEGETVTVTYTDADNGAGGVNVEVTDTAVVDCTSPVISNVQTVDIEPFEAFVTFDTNEPSLGAVRYGPACIALTEVASQSGYRTEHSVKLMGLEDDSTYFYVVDAEDEAGNPATDDNGGGCYMFNTPDIPMYFTEVFDGDNDLDNLSLTFIPNGSPDFYRGCAEPIAELPTDPAGGTDLIWQGTDDDGYATLGLTGGKTVSLYGASYSTFYPGTNGYITFGGGDTEYYESLGEHFGMPRISAVFDDLNPSSGGTVSWKQLEDRAVVTWEDVPEWNTSNSNTFQIEMYFEDGTIVISYLAIGAADGLAGLSEGEGTPPAFWETDLSTMDDCGSGDCNENGVPDYVDIAGGTSEDCNENEVPDECDIADGTSNDFNATGVPDECELVAPLPEDSLGVSCTVDDDCDNTARCVQGVCYVPKHRYVSIASNPAQVPYTARRIRLQVGMLTRWVGAPYESGGLMLADVVEAPVYSGIDFVGEWPSLLHVIGCEIAPGQVYLIQAIPTGQGIGDENSYSEALALHTSSVWGDTVSLCGGDVCHPADGLVGLDDIMAAIRKYQGADVAPITWLDIDPSTGDDKPDQIVGIGDILACIAGYQGVAYPGSGPLGCR